MDHSASERHLRDLASRFRSWLNDPGSGGSIVRELLTLNDDRLRAFVNLHDDHTVRSALTLLLGRCHEKLANAPREAVSLAHLATRVSSFFYSADPEHGFAIEGDAWKEYAAALLSAGDYRDADAACDQALLLYSFVERHRRFHERTQVTLTQAQTAYFLGASQRALEL